MRHRLQYKCPHCGNRDQEYILGNGERAGGPDFSLLCVAPCDPDETSLDTFEAFDNPYPLCGYRWQPNLEED